MVDDQLGFPFLLNAYFIQRADARWLLGWTAPDGIDVPE